MNEQMDGKKQNNVQGTITAVVRQNKRRDRDRERDRDRDTERDGIGKKNTPLE